MHKVINGFFELIGTLIFLLLLPFVLIIKLFMLIIVIALPVLVVLSPFILIGFIVWVIAS